MKWTKQSKIEELESKINYLEGNLNEEIRYLRNSLNTEIDIRRLLLKKLGLTARSNVFYSHLVDLNEGELSKLDLLIEALGYEYCPATTEAPKFIKKHKTK